MSHSLPYRDVILSSQSHTPPYAAKIPIIALTANSFQVDKDMAEEAECCHIQNMS